MIVFFFKVGELVYKELSSFLGGGGDRDYF